MYRNVLNDFVYVCPHCFNKLEYCTCLMFPHTLIQIDKKIWPTIKLLNEKWYFTEMCCEGHIGGNERIHIIFRKNNRFKSLPEGFIASDNVIYADIVGKSERSKKISKTKLLNSLHQWAISLESKNILNKKS